MASVTLSRGSTSIDIQLNAEAGTPLLSTTFGKPEIQVRQSGGTLNPRINDRWSGLESYTLEGKLYDYQTSHDLADLIKSGSTTALELEIGLAEYPDTVTVAPAAGQDTALSLSYPAGKRDNVDVSLNLTRVSEVVGIGDQSATTPTTTGSGPVEIRVNGTTVELPTADLSLERTIGRPNDAVRRVPSQSDPRYEVKAKVTSDVFTFSFQTLDNIPATLNALTDNIFRSRLGRSGVTVDFNGLLGLGEIEAIPTGSSPFRQVHQAGRGWVSNPTLEFRRIFSQ
jgi:hypothetical protein